MKMSVKNNESAFKPYTLTIEVETREDDSVLYEIANYSPQIVAMLQRDEKSADAVRIVLSMLWDTIRDIQHR